MAGRTQVQETFGHVSMSVGGDYDGVFLANLRFTDLDSITAFIALVDLVPSRGAELVAALDQAASIPEP